jgi:hypothetical protein
MPFDLCGGITTWRLSTLSSEKHSDGGHDMTAYSTGYRFVQSDLVSVVGGSFGLRWIFLRAARCAVNSTTPNRRLPSLQLASGACQMTYPVLPTLPP